MDLRDHGWFVGENQVEEVRSVMATCACRELDVLREKRVTSTFEEERIRHVVSYRGGASGPLNRRIVEITTDGDMREVFA